MRLFKNIFLTFFLFLLSLNAPAQDENFKFAYLADTHISEGSDRIDILKQCVEDINSQDDIQFSILAGDITDFGSDREIAIAKSIIDKLVKPYYVVAGNHDAKWSESGCNTFAKVFGYETFNFTKGGIRFLGCNSGPNMRMAPALIPHESLVWLDSVAGSIPEEQPVFFINHYPQDTSALNYFQVVDILKKTNIQVIMGGHWHRNVELNYLGIPGMLGRSPDGNKERGIGYNIITVADGRITASEKIVNQEPGQAWFGIDISSSPRFSPQQPTADNPYCIPDEFPWLRFDINDNYPQVKEIWSIQDDSDIGCGAIISGDKVIYANTKGVIKTLDASSGKLVWSYATEGKIFSTPATDGKRVVTGSTDSYIYCLNIKDGTVLWRHKCDKSVLASPSIYNGKCYIGASDGVFRAIDMKNGKLVWRFDKVGGFVEDKAWADDEYVIFGDWANTLYCLNILDGSLKWEWKVKKNRMYSPAAVFPVRSGNTVYITTPERKTYAIDIRNGITLWSADGGRESIGLSADKDKIFVKTMFNTIIAFRTNPYKVEKVWEVQSGLGYDIAPTPTLSQFDKKTAREYLFIPTDKGNIFCFDASDGSILWKHKVSFALINSIVPVKDNRLLISTMDGIITLIQY